jgi:hypothetical protein
MAVAILAACTIVGEGDPTTPIFCTAHTKGIWDIYALVYGFLLLLALPAIVAGLISQRFRAIAAVVGLLTIGGLIMQPTLMKSGAMGCDAP